MPQKIKRKTKMVRILCRTCNTYTTIEASKVLKVVDGKMLKLVKLPNKSPLRCKKCRLIFSQEVEENGTV